MSYSFKKRPCIITYMGRLLIVYIGLALSFLLLHIYQKAISKRLKLFNENFFHYSLCFLQWCNFNLKRSLVQATLKILIIKIVCLIYLLIFQYFFQNQQNLNPSGLLFQIFRRRKNWKSLIKFNGNALFSAIPLPNSIIP